MKANEQLLFALGTVDLRYVPDLTAKERSPFLRWAAAAGGICAALLIAVLAVHQTRIGGNSAELLTPDSPADGVGCEQPGIGGRVGVETVNGLPLITAGIESGGMGFEGLMAYSIDELENGNPWREIPSDTAALPVYKNLLYNGRWEEGADYYTTEEDMRRVAEEAAESLGMEVLSTKTDTMGEIRDTVLTERVTSLTADCAGETGSATIRVSRTGTVSAEMSPSLPFDTEEERKSALDILSTFLGYRDAVIAESGDRDIHGDLYTTVKVYEDSDDPVRKLLNYCAASSRLARLPEEGDGREVNAVVKGPGFERLEYLGDYPVITEEDAWAMLLRGEYLTTVPADTLPESGLTEDRIDRVELVYRCSLRDEYAEPYYRFFVRLREGFPASAVEGLLNWGIYYVPAVRVEYLAELPVWDGGFN